MVSNLDKAHSLITFYLKKYEERFGTKPLLNRNKIKYLISDALRDVKAQELQQAIEYYVKTEIDPSLLVFCYEYADVLTEMNEVKIDADERAQLLRETEKRTKEFRERYGK